MYVELVNFSSRIIFAYGHIDYISLLDASTLSYRYDLLVTSIPGQVIQQKEFGQSINFYQF